MILIRLSLAFVIGLLTGYGITKTASNAGKINVQAEPRPPRFSSMAGPAPAPGNQLPSHAGSRSVDLAAQLKVWLAKGWERNMQQVGDVFVEWHQLDPVQADQALSQCDDRVLQNYVLARLADLELAKGLTQAQAWTQSFGDPDLRRQAMKIVREQEIVVNPAAEWQRINQLPESLDKQNQLTEWARTVAKTNPELAWQSASDFAGDDATRTAMQREALMGWAEVHPEIAAQHLSELPAAMQAGAVAELSAIWSARDPLQAARWAASLTDGPEKDAALNDSLPKLMVQNPAAAMAIWEAVGQLPGRDQLLTQLTAIWGQTDAKAAATWLLTLPDSSAATTALLNLVQFVARTDLETARSLLDILPAGQSRDNCLSSYIDIWAERAPATALAWVASQAVDASGVARMSAAFQHVAQRAPDAAFSELAALPSGPNRDTAIAAVVSVTGEQQPDLTISWINQIANPQLRQTTLTKLAGSAVTQTSQ